MSECRLGQGEFGILKHPGRPFAYFVEPGRYVAPVWALEYLQEHARKITPIYPYDPEEP